MGGLHMERLILRCGRYVPSEAGDAALRVQTLENYVARLTEELEHLLAQMDPVLQAAETAGEEA